MSELFSERLRLLRGARTKAEFSRELGIPAPMYHRYEAGQVPKETNLRVIADRGGVTVDWLLGRGDDGTGATLSELHDRGVMKLEKGQEPAKGQLHDRGVRKLEKGRCLYPEACDLEGELASVRERLEGVEGELSYMRTQLETVVGLLGAAVGKGMEAKAGERKAG